MNSVQTMIEETIMTCQTADRYDYGRRWMRLYSGLADFIQDRLDMLSFFDVMETGDPELVGAAKQWQRERKLCRDVDAELLCIKRDGIRGYLQENGLLTVVHPSSKRDGWWQATVYNIQQLTINGDTQHKSVADVFDLLGAGIPTTAKALGAKQLEPLLNRFVGKYSG